MEEPTATYCIVWITAGSMDEASAIAQALVEERLAACCNVIPGIRSVYRWQDAVQVDAEVLLICKTRRSVYDGLAERVRELHSYDVPEIICTDIACGSVPYLKWIDESLSPAP
jgi:periplasmic divalent cation tolerance protein